MSNTFEATSPLPNVYYANAYGTVISDDTTSVNIASTFSIGEFDQNIVDMPLPGLGVVSDDVLNFGGTAGCTAIGLGTASHSNVCQFETSFLHT